MAGWEYERVESRWLASDRTIKQSRDGHYYVDNQTYGRQWLVPDAEWAKEGPLGWGDCLARDPNSGFWDLETRVLNKLGQQGWEMVTAHTLGASGICTYIFKRVMGRSGS